VLQVLENTGAGEGNRTLVFSLEGCCSTIELHPRKHVHYHAGRTASTAPGPLQTARFRPIRLRALTAAGRLPILRVPLTKKGGDLVSCLKRCHLAGIAR
jgi:hypothetical protein